MTLIIDFTTGNTKDTLEIECEDKADGIAQGKAFLRMNGLTHENIVRARFVVRDSFLSMIAPALSPSVGSSLNAWARKVAA